MNNKHKTTKTERKMRSGHKRIGVATVIVPPFTQSAWSFWNDESKATLDKLIKDKEKK